MPPKQPEEIPDHPGEMNQIPEQQAQKKNAFSLYRVYPTPLDYYLRLGHFRDSVAVGRRLFINLLNMRGCTLESAIFEDPSRDPFEGYGNSCLYEQAKLAESSQQRKTWIQWATGILTVGLLALLLVGKWPRARVPQSRTQEN